MKSIKLMLAVMACLSGSVLAFEDVDAGDGGAIAETTESHDSEESQGTEDESDESTEGTEETSDDPPAEENAGGPAGDAE